MWKTIILSLIIVAIAVAFLGIRVFFSKKGKFPNSHVSGNKALRDRGITCVQSQDKAARSKT